MTTEQKFNYIKNFGTYGLDGKTYFALPMKYPEKEYQTMNDIFVSSGYFVLDDFWALAEQACQFSNYFEYVLEFSSYMGVENVEILIDTCYNTLLEFENKVKQLNGG